MLLELKLFYITFSKHQLLNLKKEKAQIRGIVQKILKNNNIKWQTSKQNCGTIRKVEKHVLKRYLR